MILTSQDVRTVNIIVGLLLSILVCLNGIRCMLGITESSMIFNLLYLLFIVVCIPRIIQTNINSNENRKRSNRSDVVYYMVSIFLALFCVITGVFDGQYVSLSKFLVIILTGFCIIHLEKSEIEICINCSVIISFIYVIYVITHTSNVNSYIAKGSNYLNVTLPIGLILSVLLTRGVFGLTIKKNKIMVGGNIVLSGVFLYALTLFSARGSILLPILAVLLVGLLIGRKNIKTFIVVIITLSVMLYVGYLLFSKYAGSYLLLRMTKLFESNESEDRWQIWSNYIELIKTERLWLFGGGTNYSSVHFGMYPHNFYLQLIGEFGLVGICYSIVTTVYVLKNMIFEYALIKTRQMENNVDAEMYYEILAALLYVFFTFMKSFSIFDSSLLFIFFSMGISLHRNNET